MKTILKTLTLTCALALSPLVPGARAYEFAGAVEVWGTSNPWLAGMADGSTAYGTDIYWPPDTAPEQSPMQDLFAGIAPGNSLMFVGTGQVNNQFSPDGGSFRVHPAENGISAFEGPTASLLGVFLDDSQPNLSLAPDAFPYLPNDAMIAPDLKQVFFIGDGFTANGVLQQFQVPAGATRLYLGVMDDFNWKGNSGKFEAWIVVPEPSSAALALTGVFSLCVLSRKGFRSKIGKNLN